MAKQITKSYLEYLGVTDITSDGRIFTARGELKPHLLGSNGKERPAIILHDSEKYKSIPKEKRHKGSGQVHIAVHKAVFAWFNQEVPYNKEIHHVDANRFNNNIDNLVALTHEEHVQAHSGPITKEISCMLNKPRSYYEDKLAYYESIEPKTKIIRNNIWRYKCHLNYYDSHIDEYKHAQTKLELELGLLKEWRKLFKDWKNTEMRDQMDIVIKNWKKYSPEQRQHVFDTLHDTFGSKY